MLKVLFYISLIVIPSLTLILKNTTSFLSIGYLGVVMCLILGILGTVRGMSSIAKYVSGVCISTPRVSNKSIFGTVICEAGLILSILHCIIMCVTLNNMKDTLINNYLILCSGMIVGTGFYFSSTAVGIICGVISLADAKNAEIFFKLVVLEFIPASVGLLGFILGIILTTKAKNL
ncbi:V-type proton ATPase 21 kDa proteolipid subunit [Vairimorpha necatrix]|uniref:V-type proton ATPase 21 kDa proteolipid subunit n=1 Tax=Vairimorpha necatrix TaxID=6039 RepID=A0AAX4JBS6_9MICR